MRFDEGSDGARPSPYEGSDDGSAGWAAAQAAAAPAPPRGSAAYFRGLPLATRIEFSPHASKRGKSRARLERYRKATTLLELQRLNPSKFIDDLKYDWQKKFLKIVPQDSVLRAVLVAAPPSPLVLGTPALGDFIARQGERGFERDLARWARLRLSSPALDRVCGHEDLEESPWGPALAGEPGAIEALLRFTACPPGELVDDGDGLLTGTDFLGYKEIPGPPGATANYALASVLRARGGGGAGTTGPIGSVDGIRSVLEAKAHPRWEVDLKDAVAKEFKRVLGKPGPDSPGAFEALTFITETDKRNLIAKYGEDRVFTQNLVLAVKEKPGSANAAPKARARIVIADLANQARSDRPIDTFVANVDGNPTRLLAQLSVQHKDYYLDSNDCKDAYYKGTPYSMDDPKGRILLGRIPKGWEEFGYPQFNERGEKLYAQPLKNMPGRREAGKIFGDFYREKLLQWGFLEGVVDRRVFVKQVTNWWGRLNNNALSKYYKARQVWVFGAAKHERALSSSESDPPPVGYKKKFFRQLGSGLERT